MGKQYGSVQDVIEAFVTGNGFGKYGEIATPKGTIRATKEVIRSYSEPIGVRFPSGRVLLNSDVFSITSGRHTRGLLRAMPDAPQTSFTALERVLRPRMGARYSVAAQVVIDEERVRVLDFAAPTWATFYRDEAGRLFKLNVGVPVAVARDGEQTVSMKLPNYLPSGGVTSVDEPAMVPASVREGVGMFFDDFPHHDHAVDGVTYKCVEYHITGAAVLRVVPFADAWGNAPAAPVWCYAGVDERQSFVAVLPRKAVTIPTALRALKPSAVLRAEKAGRKVARQGDWFFIDVDVDEVLRATGHTSKTSLLRAAAGAKPLPDRTADSTSNHHVCRYVTGRDGTIYATGTVRHRTHWGEASGEHAAHKINGWAIAVQNTALASWGLDRSRVLRAD